MTLNKVVHSNGPNHFVCSVCTSYTAKLWLSTSPQFVVQEFMSLLGKKMCQNMDVSFNPQKIDIFRLTR